MSATDSFLDPLEIQQQENRPFSLPDSFVTFSLEEGTSFSVDAVELHHRLEAAIEETKLAELFPSRVIPLFQTILAKAIGRETIGYSQAYFVYKLVDEKFAEAKKKFEQELTLRPTSPE